MTVRELENKNNSGRRSRQQLYCRPESKLYRQQHSQPKRSYDSQVCSLSPAPLQLREGGSAWVHVKARVTRMSELRVQTGARAVPVLQLMLRLL